MRTAFTVTPKRFQVVIAAFLRLKDMHDQFAVIEQGPTALVHPFFA
jgi:hypothetical protein